MATYDYGAPLARARETLARPEWWRGFRTWLGFLAGLAVLMTALLIGPRVEPQDQKQTCVGNVELPGPFGLSLNCDSPQFMALARDPSALLAPDNARQARPGLIAVAVLLERPLALLFRSYGPPAKSVEQGLQNPAQITRSFSQDLPAYFAYVIINVATLLASFHLLRLIVLPWAGRDGTAGLVIAASGLILVANDVVKAFVWSPHTQMFNVLVPLLALYATWRAWNGAMADRSFALAMGVIAGLGFTAYPVFVVIPACIVPAAMVALWRDRAVARPVAINATLLLALCLLPYALWYAYVRAVTGGFFHMELALGEVSWMAKSWAKGPGVLVADWLDKAWQFIAFAAPQAIALAGLTAWLLLAALFDPAAKASLKRTLPMAWAALYVSFVVLGFYTCVGWTVDRLAYPIIPPLLAAAAVGAVAIARRLNAQRRHVFAAGCALIALAQVIYVVLKDGPWS